MCGRFFFCIFMHMYNNEQWKIIQFDFFIWPHLAASGRVQNLVPCSQLELLCTSLDSRNFLLFFFSDGFDWHNQLSEPTSCGIGEVFVVIIISCWGLAPFCQVVQWHIKFYTGQTGLLWDNWHISLFEIFFLMLAFSWTPLKQNLWNCAWL